jgi:hypothetical protein
MNHHLFRKSAMFTPTMSERAANLLRSAAIRACRKSRVLAATGLFALTIGAGARADEAVGVVRISDQPVTPVSNVEYRTNETYSAPAATNASCPNMATGPVLELSGNPITDYWRQRRFERRLEKEADQDYCPKCHRYHRHNSDGHCDNCDGRGGGRLHAWLAACDQGYGYRFLDFHCYHMMYPVEPWYYDTRDTRVYAAAGFGAPMAVPLAPNVGQQYNYGWGIPSSRITPISRVSEQPGAMLGAVAPR